MAKSRRKLIKENRSYEKSAKAQVKSLSRSYKRIKKASKADAGSPAQKKLLATKAELKDAKARARQLRNKSVKLKRSGAKVQVAQQLRHQSRVQGESLLRDNDGLEDLATARSKIREVKTDVALAKNLSKYTLKSTVSVGKSAATSGYSVANRTYNLARGNGFVRTAPSKRWEVKLKNRLKKARSRLARTKFGKFSKKSVKTVKLAGKTIRWVSKPFLHILLNPLSISSFVILFLMFLILSVFSFSPSSIQQDEFDLNDSWLLLTKLDRQKSTDGVDYWTNIDDVLFYMNYRYDGFTLSEDWPEKSGILTNTMSDALKDVWKQLNGDSENLKSMKDLYTDKDSWLKLDKEDLSDYEELLELSEETGRYSAYQNLENPLYPETEEEESTDTTLIIGSRFGHISKKEIQKFSIIQASQGQEVYAAMSGDIKIDGDNLIIDDGISRLTYHDLDSKRYKKGASVQSGDLLGKVSSNDGLKLTYEKLNEKDKWIPVNIGFYFEKVRYNQTTSVLTSLDFDTTSSDKFTKIYERIRKKKPKATINGVSAMLGNFETESGTTAKRAEGDYLSPPIGASKDSWDDDAWLKMSGPEIYNGKYPNIKHRGLGLGQWTDTHDGSNRHTLLLLYAEEKGKKWYDLDLQIDFMLEGDNPYYLNILDEILTSKESVDVLTERFLVYWEGNSGDKLLERQNNAKQIAQYLKQPLATMATGKTGHPFTMPYTVLQPYGRTPWSQGGGAWMYPKGYHDGVDIVPTLGDFANTDVPILSMTNGEVAAAWGTELGGYAIVIKTDFGGYIYYGHIKYFPSLKVGTKVKIGQQIAVLGNTGAGGIYHIHLHYMTDNTNPLANDDKDPSFLFRPSGTLKQNEIIKP